MLTTKEINLVQRLRHCKYYGTTGLVLAGTCFVLYSVREINELQKWLTSKKL